MKLSTRQIILAVYLVVLAVGVLLSTLIYIQGREVMGVTLRLIGADLPTLKTLSNLKADIAQQEPILYEYYATVDREKFLKRAQSNEKQIEAGLRVVRDTFPESKPLAEIEANYALIRLLSEQLDETLSATQIDWDKARFLLSVISKLAVGINGNLDALVGSIQDTVFSRGDEAQEKILTITGMVVVFSATLFLVAVFVGYYVNAYLSEVAARRRLAMFAERNPNPVLSLTADASVVYANPGATRLLNEIGPASAPPATLLPADLPERLKALEASAHDHEEWEYTVFGRTFDCVVHLLRDFGVFHAYLTDITERKRAEARLIHAAYHDALTGLPNRRMFQERIEAALARVGEDGFAAVMLLNVDRFKRVLNSLGHVAGDRLLQAIAERLSRVLTDCADGCSGASLYRFEGDQFALLIPEMPQPDAPTAVARAISASMGDPLPVAGRELFAALSIGISVFPADGRDAVTLVKNADSAMRRVKQRGGNGYQCYTQEMNARALESLELESGLRHALERNELELHYQPQVDIPTGRMVGAEALIRWHHPEQGLVSPEDFIPLAEETGLVVPIGEWVLRTACAQARAWQDAGLRPMVIGVNLSARQFRDRDLPQTVRGILADTALPPECLELEITETVAMENVELTVATLQELKALGIRLCIDDFGTGYSSLSYLKRFPLDKLKVDQSFIRNLATDANDSAIVRAVITLGHILGLRVIAEGVESAQHLALLQQYRCEEIQGYLFSRPVPGETFARLLREERCLALAAETETA